MEWWWQWCDIDDAVDDVGNGGGDDVGECGGGSDVMVGVIGGGGGGWNGGGSVAAGGGGSGEIMDVTIGGRGGSKDDGIWRIGVVGGHCRSICRGG